MRIRAATSAMSGPNRAVFAVLAASLCSAAAAQVPVGHAVHGAVGTTTTPLVVLDRTPSVTPVSGGAFADVNAVRIDPLDGSLWLASASSLDLRRGRLDFAAGRLVGETVVATLPAPSLEALAFDADGHALVGGGDVSSNGGIRRVDRFTGAVTPVLDAVAGLQGHLNALAEDPATGDVYFALFGTGEVFRIPPPQARNTHVRVGSVAAHAALPTGLAFARTHAQPNGVLFVTAFGGTANASLVTLDPTSGAAVAVPGSPAWSDLNGIAYDRVRGDLWLLSTLPQSGIHAATTTGANALVHRVAGNPAALAVNDVDPTAAVVLVAPMHVPVPARATPVELCVQGRPGEVGVVAVTSPAPIVVAVGLVGPDGRFAVRLPPLVVAPSNPGSITFVGGTVDVQSFAVTASAPLPWPRN